MVLYGDKAAKALQINEEVLDRIVVMCRQERESYAYQRFLPASANGPTDSRISITWREKICQWSYSVIDHFDLSREVVAVSLSLFDRYLATCGNDCNGNLALLTSLTTLHIAIKLHDAKKMKIGTLANLSRGQFGPRDIEKMEWKVLAALQWKLHPPTQYAFVTYLLLLLPTEVNPSVRQELFELSRYLTELAVCDSFFVSVDNSTVAYAAILNIMEEIGYSRFSAGLRETFLNELYEIIGLSPRSPDVITARERLRTMFYATSNRDKVPAAEPSFNRAPVDVENASVAGSLSSSASNGSSLASRYANRMRSNSMESKSSSNSYRYSPSPMRRCVISPITTNAGSSRAQRSSSPMVASVQ